MFTSERLEKTLFQETSVLYLMALNKTGGSYVATIASYGQHRCRSDRDQLLNEVKYIDGHLYKCL